MRYPTNLQSSNQYKSFFFLLVSSFPRSVWGGPPAGTTNATGTWQTTSQSHSLQMQHLVWEILQSSRHRHITLTLSHLRLKGQEPFFSILFLGWFCRFGFDQFPVSLSLGRICLRLRCDHQSSDGLGAYHPQERNASVFFSFVFLSFPWLSFPSLLVKNGSKKKQASKLMTCVSSRGGFSLGMWSCMTRWKRSCEGFSKEN